MAMKVAILAGGLVTRLREETEIKPKPMVEVGGRPILWHIQRIDAYYGYSAFIICLVYRGDAIRDYFFDYELQDVDITLTLGTRSFEAHDEHAERSWKVTLAETGEKTLTGGRVKRVARVFGRIKPVLFDDREASPTKGELMECFLGPDDYSLVLIPPRVWNGLSTPVRKYGHAPRTPRRPGRKARRPRVPVRYAREEQRREPRCIGVRMRAYFRIGVLRGMSEPCAIVANYSTHPHDPTCSERLDPFGGAIPYDWAVRHR